MDFFNLRDMTATFSFRKLEKLGAQMSHLTKAYKTCFHCCWLKAPYSYEPLELLGKRCQTNPFFATTFATFAFRLWPCNMHSLRVEKCILTAHPLLSTMQLVIIVSLGVVVVVVTVETVVVTVETVVVTVEAVVVTVETVVVTVEAVVVTVKQ